jgi:hypothetical protein
VWSWRDLLALSYLHVAERSEQGGKRLSLGRSERPAGVATHQVDGPSDGERPVAGTSRMVMDI